MPIHFYLRNIQICASKEEIITIIKRIKNIFQRDKLTIHDMKYVA